MINQFIAAFITIFVVMDALGVMPLYLAMSVGNSAEQKRATCRRAGLVSAVVLSGFALFGNQVMAFFRITIPALQVAGGIILFVIAMQMLQARRVYARESRRRSKRPSKRKTSPLCHLPSPCWRARAPLPRCWCWPANRVE